MNPMDGRTDGRTGYVLVDGEMPKLVLQIYRWSERSRESVPCFLRRKGDSRLCFDSDTKNLRRDRFQIYSFLGVFYTDSPDHP